MPWVSLEEAEVIEEASRRVGKEPAQFIKDAGLAVALAVLDGKAEQGRGHKPRSLLSACLDPFEATSGTSEWRKYCVSGATNIHRKYCVDGFR